MLLRGKTQSQGEKEERHSTAKKKSKKQKNVCLAPKSTDMVPGKYLKNYCSTRNHCSIEGPPTADLKHGPLTVISMSEQIREGESGTLSTLAQIVQHLEL